MVLLCYTCHLCCNGLNELSASSSKKRHYHTTLYAVNVFLELWVGCNALLQGAVGGSCSGWVPSPELGADPGWGAPKMRQGVQTPQQCKL